MKGSTLLVAIGAFPKIFDFNLYQEINNYRD